MASWRDFGNIWTTFRELDVRPIREEAEQPVVMAIVGAPASGKSALISALQHDTRKHEQVITPAIEADLDKANHLGTEDIIVLVLDATRSGSGYAVEEELYRQWKREGRKVIVYYNKMDLVGDNAQIGGTAALWGNAQVTYGSATDPISLQSNFVPAVIHTLPDQSLSLARHYPIFRIPVARDLIGDTSFANATYSLGTGLAEVIPALDIPFNVADMVVLTKNQAIMVYKLGLSLGLSPRWQDHVTQLGGVVGAGFFWRQISRQLVGLIPVWGIVPKVAVAYAGTYAVGEAVIYWYQTGHKMSRQRMHELYVEALDRGRQVAQSLLKRSPRPALPRPSMPSMGHSRAKNSCAECGRGNPSDAIFCAYCGAPMKAQQPDV